MIRETIQKRWNEIDSVEMKLSQLPILLFGGLLFLASELGFCKVVRFWSDKSRIRYLSNGVGERETMVFVDGFDWGFGVCSSWVVGAPKHQNHMFGGLGYIAPVLGDFSLVTSTTRLVSLVSVVHTERLYSSLERIHWARGVIYRNPPKMWALVFWAPIAQLKWTPKPQSDPSTNTSLSLSPLF